MNKKLKEAFGQVHAQPELKNRTKEYIFQKTNGYRHVRRNRYKYLLPAFACLALVLFCGRWLYFTPTVGISIDINPSIELGVNRFNRIVSLESFNDDGQNLIDSLDIKYMDYYKAVNEIMENETVVSLLSNNEILTISVIGTDDTQSEEILSNIQSCTAGKNNTYCYYAHSDEAEEAHEAGFSCGKYKAYLELQALDPSITAEEVQSMTMREIRDLIDTLSESSEDEAANSGNSTHEIDHSENGHGHKEHKRGQQQFSCFP